MDHNFYRNTFQAVISKTSQKKPEDMEIAVDEVMESVALKVYKPTWSNDPQFPLTARGRIFFSIWAHDKTIQENRIYYNIHAFKLRELKGYKIASRSFAERFREQFSNEMKNWSNVTIQHGPLTLMEGWIDLKMDTIENDITELVQRFLEMSFMIDETLDHYKVG